jgi:hypothetical protein
MHEATEDLKFRTVALSQLPKWVGKRHVIDTLSNFGSVLAVDMPMTDQRLQKIAKTRPNLEAEMNAKVNYEERVKAADDYLKNLHLSQNPSEAFANNFADFSVLNPKSEETLSEKVMELNSENAANKILQKLIPEVPQNLAVLNEEKRLKVLTL